MVDETTNTDSDEEFELNQHNQASSDQSGGKSVCSSLLGAW
jgi:hypothetical protein